VERWFGIITQRAIRRGSFSSVKELIAKIEQFLAAYNKTKAPFNWTATADSILEKLQRLCSQISWTGHEPPFPWGFSSKASTRPCSKAWDLKRPCGCTAVRVACLASAC
jgi:hypothetical protein